MTREKIIRIILIAAAPVIIFIWARNFGIFQNRSSRGRLGTSLSANATAFETQEIKRHTVRSEYTSWGRDPFFAGQVSGPSSSLSLQGIVMDPLSPFAIINGEIVKEGETIGGATVVLIQKAKVILKKGKEEIVLELFQ